MIQKNLHRKLWTDCSIWALLAAVTLLSYALGDVPELVTWQWSTPLIVTLSLIKCRLVVMHFMEVNHASRALRLVFDGWLVAVAGGILALLRT